MRFLRGIPILLLIAIIWLLDHPMGALPALGRLLDPVNGALAAAEPVKKNFSLDEKIEGLHAPVNVWMEGRLVPHVDAQNDHDLYFVQGYIHAYFRLWQMDMATRAAAGRVSEVAGDKTLAFDRGQRRKGMVFGAERSLVVMEKDPRTKLMLDAYREGVNAYIHSLNYRSLPLEYKLMGFYPEDWTNLRTALMAKNLADDLSSKTDDFALTLLRDQLGQTIFDQLFPERIPGSSPVIPKGTIYPKPSLTKPGFPGDSVWARLSEKDQNAAASVSDKIDQDVALGSNNWAVSGKRTNSGKAILCNDPHLALSLPSIWFEMQLTAPGINVYGASLPGAPGVVIGYNQNISWGFTNNYRDVRDFYEIQPADASNTHYIFGGKQLPYDVHVERIKVKGKPDFLDTVRYTLHGPMNYDPSYPDPSGSNKWFASTWMAHRASNEMLAVYLLNRASDYPTFTQAIQQFECPAQNIAYADVNNNIALWGQGRYINKWPGQGRFVMEGRDSSTLWGNAIPMDENPHVLNPPQGFVASANQAVTDSTYPYWYDGDFVEFRSWMIQRMLPSARTPEDMMRMQNSNLSGLQLLFAPIALKYLNAEQQKRLTDELQIEEGSMKSFNGMLSPESRVASAFQLLFAFLYKGIWSDDISGEAAHYPSYERTLQMLATEPTSPFYDDRRTKPVERLLDLMNQAVNQSIDSMRTLKAQGNLDWFRVKNTTVRHLARIPAFSYDHLYVGGWSQALNACTPTHGPSWRMIVEMDEVPKAYGVYPGGQSGNPGSPHYGDFLDAWQKGRYYPLQFVVDYEKNDRFPYTWTLRP
jgi:penicillin amidase